MKKATILAIFLVGILALCGLASAAPSVEYVKINGDIFESGDTLALERGEALDIKVKLQAVTDEEDIEITADILGYEYSDYNAISDRVHIMDMQAGDTEYENLGVTLPQRAEKDRYDLRIRIGGRTGASEEYLINLRVKDARHKILIQDIVFSPEGSVMSGRALLAAVRIKNYGENDEKSIKVTVKMPELGISASDYIDELDYDATDGTATTSEELYLRIPSCVKAGEYTVIAEVSYDEGYEVITKETSILVTEDELCPAKVAKEDTKAPKTVISVGSTAQDVAAGEGGVIYPLTISNSGAESKAYTIVVEGVDAWGQARISPTATAVLAPGEAKAFYVYVSANENAGAGEKMFSITVKSGDETLKQIPVKANVVESQTSWSKLKRGLEIGFVILVVLLVILGLIIGFNKLREDKNEEDMEETETYY